MSSTTSRSPGAEAQGIRGGVEKGDRSARRTPRCACAGVTGGLNYAISGAFKHTDGTIDNLGGEHELRSDTFAASGNPSIPSRRISGVKAQAGSDRLRWQRAGFQLPVGTNLRHGDQRQRSLRDNVVVRSRRPRIRGRGRTLKKLLTARLADRRSNAFGGPFHPADVRSSGSEGSRTKATFVTSFDFGTPELAHKLTGAIDLGRGALSEHRSHRLRGYDGAQRQHVRLRRTVRSHLQRPLGAEHAAPLGSIRGTISTDTFTYRVQGSYRFDSSFRLHAATGTNKSRPRAVLNCTASSRRPAVFHQRSRA